MLHAVAVLTALGLTAAQAPSPQWQSDYATALEQTRSDDRPLLMVIDQPGQQDASLSQEVLNSNADGALADYDLCHVDASTEYGAKVAKAFGTTSYPYIAFIDKSGKKILHSESGKLDTAKWNELVGKYRAGNLPARVSVSKPVVTTSPVSTTVRNYDSYQQYMPQAKPYCAKCQRAAAAAARGY